MNMWEVFWSKKFELSKWNECAVVVLIVVATAVFLFLIWTAQSNLIEIST